MKELEIRDRFVRDTGLQIPVLESPYFEYHLSLYRDQWKSFSKWAEFQELLSKDPRFVDKCFLVRNQILKSIEENEEFKKFNNRVDLSKWSNPYYKGNGSKSIYNQENVGKDFISIDLVKANIQALNNSCPGIFGDTGFKDINEVWREWIEGFCEGNSGMAKWISESKHIRQKLLGLKNPSRQIMVERWMIGLAANHIINSTELKEEDIAFISQDEVVFKSNIVLDEKVIWKETGIQVKIKNFKLKSYSYLTGNGNTIRTYVKENTDGTKDFKGIPKNYLAQIYQDIVRFPPDPEERDLVFYNDVKDICKFTTRLRRYDSTETT